MSLSQIIHHYNRRSTRIFPQSAKIYHFCLVALTLIASVYFIKIAFAQNLTESTQYIKDKQNAIIKGNNQESWLNEAMGSNMITTFQTVSGKIPDEVLDGEIFYFVPGGALGVTNNLVASLYNQPASGIEYIAQIKDNFLGKPAYAQGIGFSKLAPILPLWRGFRNVIYLLSSIFFIITGIMIMLRVKISPQAVVTVQSAIPKIVTTLILVTFSYAIAGLLIDLANFVQAIVLVILFQNSETAKGLLSGQLFTKGYNPTFADLSQASFGTSISLAFKAIPFFTLMTIGLIPGAILGLIFLPWTLGASAVVGAVLGPILVAIIVSILMLWWTIKFFFGLIKCYVNIILKIILAPLEIGIGAIPNMKMGFSSWLTDLIANLSVFPISIIFLVIANIIIDATAYKGLWYPNLLDASNFLTPIKVMAGASGGLVPVGIGLAAMSLLSKLPTMIPEFIFQIKPSPWGKAIGESFGPATKTMGGLGKHVGDISAEKANSRFGEPGTAGAPRTRSQSIVHGITSAWQKTREKH